MQPFWISAAVKTPCNEACGEFNDGLNVFRCGKEAMAAINSTEAIEALVAELGLPNTTCTEEGGSRDGGGSPFTRGPPDNDCCYWDPTKPASDIDCDDVSVNKRTPLCYCVPASWQHSLRSRGFRFIFLWLVVPDQGGTGCSMASFAIARTLCLRECVCGWVAWRGSFAPVSPRPFLLLGCIGSPGIHGSFQQAQVQGRLVGLAVGHE